MANKIQNKLKKIIKTFVCRLRCHSFAVLSERRQCLNSTIFFVLSLAYVIYFTGTFSSPKANKKIGTIKYSQKKVYILISCQETS